MNSVSMGKYGIVNLFIEGISCAPYRSKEEKKIWYTINEVSEIILAMSMVHYSHIYHYLPHWGGDYGRQNFAN